MDDLVRYYRECGSPMPENTFNDANDEITVIELARHGPDGPIQHEILKLSGALRDTWMAAETSRADKMVLLQLLQLKIEKDMQPQRWRLDISKANFDAVVRKFDLDNAIGYGCSTLEVCDQFSDSHRDSKWTSFSLHSGHYFAQYHKFRSDTRMNQGIYWTYPHLLSFMQQAVVHQRVLADHPFYLSLCTAVALGAMTDSRLSFIQHEIASIEHRTGFNVWIRDSVRPAEGDYSTLSAKASGYASSLAGNKRMTRMTRSVLTMFDRCAATHASTVRGVCRRRAETVAARVDLLLHRSESQLNFIDVLIARAQNQSNAVSRKIKPARNVKY